MDSYYGLLGAFSLGVLSVMSYGKLNCWLRRVWSGGETIVRKAGKGGDYKMVVAVRSDLGLGKGKIAAQCCHAALACYRLAEKTQPETLTTWSCLGQPKIVLKLDPKEGEKMLYSLYDQARQVGLPSRVIHDAGHTQVGAGTATVVGVGPGPASLVDQVTGHLRLL